MNIWDEQIMREMPYRERCRMGLEDADAFVEGARWQRQALLSDEAVGRAARVLCAAAGESPDSNELWDEEPPWLHYTDEARAALAAALGEDET